MIDARRLLRDMLQAAIDSAQPSLCVPLHLPPPPAGRTIVIGAGKASAAMARAVETAWDGPLEGIVVTQYGYAVGCAQIEIVEASHPVPDVAGEAAAARILELAAGAGADDLVLCLISGGGSALMPLPAAGLSLDDKQAVNRALLRSGADIAEMNCVRKHLSAIKGGRLAAAAAPARLVTLLISDVPGDDPSIIASGPTVADPTTAAEALAILNTYGITEPAAALDHLRKGLDESPKPGDPHLSGATNVLVATPKMALEAAAAVAQAAGVMPVILGDAIEGEALEVAGAQAAAARRAATNGQPPLPVVLLSGGETTVTVRGNGRGGRNAEYLLALALALDGHPGITALAADTDGIDGTEDNAGAYVTPDTVRRAAAAGVDPAARLADNDGYTVFEAIGDLLVIGPTLTNVNDFRAILVQ
jgi:hydroxypyruvate reductase